VGPNEDDCEGLEKQIEEAAVAFQAASAKVNERIGISPRDEYQKLLLALEDSWLQLKSLRNRLDRRMRDRNQGAAAAS
jgi:hypothetical protein